MKPTFTLGIEEESWAVSLARVDETGIATCRRRDR